MNFVNRFQTASSVFVRPSECEFGKAMPKYLLFLLTLLATAVSFARGAPEADTFLWKVSKSGRPDAYLLGTVHVGKVGSRLGALPQQALDKVAQVVVESNADELAQPRHAAEAARMMQLMSDKRTLNQSLGRARVWALSRMAAQGHDPIDISGSRHDKPWVVWAMLQTAYSPKGYSYQYGVDNLLIEAAQKQQKPVIALERSEPLHYFNAIPENTVKRSLDMLIRHHRAVLSEQKKLVEDYQAGRAGALWQEISNPQTQLKYQPKQDHAYWHDFMYQKLLIERNQQWLPRLIEILPQKPTLVAVGAAHLFGEQGLILRLRQVGYQVTPVLPESVRTSLEN
ncbi:TraB/GumN family protein [Uruburuella testudinis]|uniref:TraB/GumN family protein n=1 Tax=Uruburuella testudinis TaxID=1282863 RepID=A0ABY4DT22_9NEIS|nr:TraB/GumN family protein [Uruburuella testudinis]UOO81568.1 TraB/GumN family protein [Uruburuella testudinis]